MIKPTIVLEYSHLSHQGSSVLLCVMLPSNMGIKSLKPKPYYFQNFRWKDRGLPWGRSGVLEGHLSSAWCSEASGVFGAAQHILLLLRL